MPIFKRTREERQADRAAKKECGAFCGPDTKVKKQKLPKAKRKSGEQRVFVASESTEHINPITTKERVPGMDVQARVWDTGGTTKSTQLTGDVKTDVEAGKDIGFSPKGVIKTESGNVAPGGIEETTNGGLKRDYYRKGLYRKSKSGDVHKIKGYSTYSEGGHQKELIKTSRGGDVAMFKSTEGMTKGEKHMHKKSARQQGDGTRYISEQKLERKTERIDKRINKRKGKVGILSKDKTKEKFLGQKYL